MTHDEAMEQFRRLLANCVAPIDPDGVFVEWCAAFAHSSVDDVADGITALLRTKADRFWPSIGELRGVIGALQASRGDTDTRRCETCRGSGWVESRPFRALGDHIYEAVEPCQTCRPSAVVTVDPRRSPLNDVEYLAWRQAQRPTEPITSRAELLARVQAIAAAARMPRARRAEGEQA